MKQRTLEEVLKENQALERVIMRMSRIMKSNDARDAAERFDVELFDRLIHERNELDYYLTVAQETIRVQSERINELEHLTKHFTVV